MAPATRGFVGESTGGLTPSFCPIRGRRCTMTTMERETLLWIVFGALVVVMLLVDLGLHRDSHEVGVKEAAAWSLVWIAVSIAFCGGIWLELGPRPAAEFFTGYVVEKSLSVDNLFVFIMIFSYFGVPRAYQPKILKWGIVGALVLRAVFIFVGLEMLRHFEWMIYVFGALLVLTGVKMLRSGEDEVQPEKNILVRVARRLLPVTRRNHGDRFFVRRGGLVAATPLFLTLLVVESSDVLFAVDSIPAVFAVTRDPFIVYTSNVFAILGLRALYFLLAGVMGMFQYLRLGVCVVLIFVGVKMLVSQTRFAVPIGFSMGVIVGVLSLSVLASVVIGKVHARRAMNPRDGAP